MMMMIVVMLRLTKKAFHLNTYHIVCCFPDDNPFLGQDIGPIVGKWFEAHWDCHAAGAQVISELFSKPARLLVGRGEEVAETWLLEDRKMWTRFYPLGKKCIGKRPFGQDFHFSCLPFLRLLMKIRNYKFIWNLEVYASVEQILHHGRVFVCSRHVQNILSIVPGWRDHLRSM